MKSSRGFSESLKMLESTPTSVIASDGLMPRGPKRNGIDSIGSGSGICAAAVPTESQATRHARATREHQPGIMTRGRV